MMKTIAIIPARGGSKGLPRKNIKELAGMPLIAYTIEAALNSKKLSEVYVSTEDDEIANISEKYGAKIIPRPKELALDDTPTLEVLKHGIAYLEKIFNEQVDIIVTLQATSPIRKEGDIDKAIQLLKEKNCDSVVSVCEVSYPLEWMKRIEGDGKVVQLIESRKEYTRRQDIPKAYRINGSIYVTKRDVIMNENKILGNDTRAFIMSEPESVDIDTEFDFRIAELILKQRKNNK